MMTDDSKHRRSSQRALMLCSNYYHPLPSYNPVKHHSPYLTDTKHIPCILGWIVWIVGWSLRVRLRILGHIGRISAARLLSVCRLFNVHPSKLEPLILRWRRTSHILFQLLQVFIRDMESNADLWIQVVRSLLGRHWQPTYPWNSKINRYALYLNFPKLRPWLDMCVLCL